MREKLQRATPRWYNPYLHLAIPSVFGLAVIVWAIFTLDHLNPIELATIPAVLLLSNAVEWRAHKDLLHKRSWIAPVLYDRHTPLHHMLFITDDMEVRNTDEWRLVLIPPYGIMLIGLLNTPITLAFWYLGMPNVAMLYIATALFYVLAYEWLHLAFHAPQKSFVGRMALIRVLRRHHAIHHDPRLMQRYNFNVVVPLWDLLRRTYVSAEGREKKLARPRRPQSMIERA